MSSNLVLPPTDRFGRTFLYNRLMIEPKIITETDEFFVINKPAGYSVEPHPKYPSISDWLRQRDWFKPITQNMDRLGVVHRLDVETSGVMIWAKTAESQNNLRELWQGRSVRKTYLALVDGETPSEGEIELAIERDGKKDRQRVVMLATDKSRIAITTYTRLAVGDSGGEKVSLVKCHPITGRTHQIRVHLAAINHPILGDSLYSTKHSRQLSQALGITRHMLHAKLIELGNRAFAAEIPADFAEAAKKASIAIESF